MHIADFYKPFFYLSSFLFLIGFVRVCLSKNNLLLMMLGVEMLMLSSITFLLLCFEPFSFGVNVHINHFSVVIILLTIVVSESAIGLTLVMLISRDLNGLNMGNLSKLKG